MSHFICWEGPEFPDCIVLVVFMVVAYDNYDNYLVWFHVDGGSFGCFLLVNRTFFSVSCLPGEIFFEFIVFGSFGLCFCT